jgi:putative selenate reductase
MREAERCLSCDSACLRCVEVCPNRANVALPVPKGGAFAQSIQILHVDALCNECGNCGLFCPYEGEPFRGKPSLFRSEKALRASRNAGFCFVGLADETDEKGYALLVRDEPKGKVRALAEADWLAEGKGGSMAALAREVFRRHTYLVGGAS